MAEENRSENERQAFQALIFLGIVSTIILSTSILIGVVYSLIFSPDMKVRWYYIVALVGYSFYCLVIEFAAYVHHKKWMFPFYALSSTLVGAFFYMFLTTIIGGFALIVGLISGLNGSSGFMLVLRTSVIIGVGLPIIWGLVEGRFLLVKKVKIPLKNYEGKGARIVLISDVHLGLLVGKHRMERIIRNIRKNEPDIIVAAGDLLDTNPKFLGQMEDLIGQLPKIAPTYFVVGNHEFYHGLTDSKEFLSGLGFRVMDNRITKDKGTGLIVAGVDDPAAFENYESYREKIDELVIGAPEGKPLVLINHQPIHFRKAAEMGVGLMLSGHTHSGQMFPAGFVTKMIFKDGYKGLNKLGDSYLYVCIGSGTWGPPIRVGAPSEIVVIDLAKG
jgi:predicted MPP superfamily phosphohydrolase